jgi:hypothetical protein
MAAVPMKAQYGPTLGQLLAPRWRAAARPTRWALILGAVSVLAVLVAAGLTLENASYSHGGRLPFSFSYRGLYHATPATGEYVSLKRLSPGGRLEDSFAVEPLRLPPYAGRVSGELPLYAAGYIQALKARFPDFELRAEGKSNINVQTAYDIYFTTRTDGQTDFGRVVLYMPSPAGVREGVAIVMLTSMHPRYPLNQPPEVAVTGLLARPLRSFSFG